MLALGSGILGGTIAANFLGRDSPFVWTVSVFAGFGVGALLMGNAMIQSLANRLERAAASPDDAEPPGEES